MFPYVWDSPRFSFRILFRFDIASAPLKGTNDIMVQREHRKTEDTSLVDSCPTSSTSGEMITNTRSVHFDEGALINLHFPLLEGHGYIQVYPVLPNDFWVIRRTASVSSPRKTVRLLCICTYILYIYIMRNRQKC